MPRIALLLGHTKLQVAILGMKRAGLRTVMRVARIYTGTVVYFVIQKGLRNISVISCL